MKNNFQPNKFLHSNINRLNINNDSNLNSSEGVGSLEVTVTDRQTGMPVNNVDMEVIKLTIIGEYAERAISELVVRYSSHEDGTFPLIELPVINWPEQRYYAILDVFGYHNVTMINIPIYDDVTTKYNIELNRITSPEPIREYIRTPSRTEYRTPPIWFY